MPNEIERLHAEHGPVVRIGPNDLSFNSPEAVTSIYESGWPKGCFYAGFRNTPETGLFSETDVQFAVMKTSRLSLKSLEVHAKRRRKFALSFAMSYIRDLEPVIDSRYAILRKQLDYFAETGEVFDLRKYITYCIVDVLGELAFGEAMGNQEAADPAKIPPVSEAMYDSCVAGQVP
ncbi:hypothetical protein LTR02_017323 [Friedmanniomyces endolithicus]|nr:hypothetical protein LTR94_020292 [Friedmanniomyces endolithicus]KAK0785125.1 hypothetical protein LTR75_013618 [Friedmanniomyces endolithicus]KAK0887337.1 hypothetical protein LTR02_017323 [Friedmanniomyces endolithicus]